MRPASLPPLSREAALSRVAYVVADRLLLEHLTPYEGACALWRIATDLELPEALSYFAYPGADYGEGPENAATEQAWFDARIRETAHELLAQAPESREGPPPAP